MKQRYNTHIQQSSYKILVFNFHSGDRGNDGLNGLPGRPGLKGEPGQQICYYYELQIIISVNKNSKQFNHYL